MFETINFKIDKRDVGVLELNRPEKHNALSSTMISELAEVTKFINNEKTLRVSLLNVALTIMLELTHAIFF